MSFFQSEHTLWRLVDGLWVNVSREYISNDGSKYTNLYNYCLSDYLCLLDMDVPEYINYCLASNSYYEMKFRKHGGQINIYLHPAN